MSEGNAPEGAPQEEEDGRGIKPVRYMSPKVFEAVVESKVDMAMAEYFKALDVPAIWDKLKRHEKALYGNGRPGLIEEMAVTKPMAGKLEAHLSDFKKFEIKTMQDRTSFFARFDQIEEKVETGLKAVNDAIKPLTKLFNIATKGAVAIGFFSLLLGGLAVFLIDHWEKIAEFLKWLKTTK